ncbi:hypothetical protein VTI74DRAFT_5824 [Chaetomium olivicolor]
MSTAAALATIELASSVLTVPSRTAVSRTQTESPSPAPRPANLSLLRLTGHCPLLQSLPSPFKAQKGSKTRRYPGDITRPTWSQTQHPSRPSRAQPCPPCLRKTCATWPSAIRVRTNKLADLSSCILHLRSSRRLPETAAASTRPSPSALLLASRCGFTSHNLPSTDKHNSKSANGPKKKSDGEKRKHLRQPGGRAVGQVPSPAGPFPRPPTHGPAERTIDRPRPKFSLFPLASDSPLKPILPAHGQVEGQNNPHGQHQPTSPEKVAKQRNFSHSHHHHPARHPP